MSERIVGLGERNTHALLPELSQAEGVGPRYWLTSHDYALLESSDDRLDERNVPPADLFSLMLADGAYAQAVDSDRARARTEYLVIACYKGLWLACERLRYLYTVGSRQLQGVARIGVLIDPTQGVRNGFLPLVDEQCDSSVDDREFERIAAVAIGFVVRWAAGSIATVPYASTLSRQARRAAERAGRIEGQMASLVSVPSIPVAVGTLWTPERCQKGPSEQLERWFREARASLLRQSDAAFTTAKLFKA